MTPVFEAAPALHTRSISGRRQLALPGVLAVCLALAACGGGGGGGGVSVPALGAVTVTVTDGFGTPVAGAQVQGPLSTTDTDASGKALVIVGSPDGSASVTVSRESFVSESIVATSTTGRVNDVAVTLERATSAAGGSLASRSGALPTVDGAAQQMTFEIELVLVDGNSEPVENLTRSNFVLQPCVPDVSNDRADCVRGPAVDVAYTAATALPESAEPIAAAPAVPYAAALLLDQSGSTLESDPTGARLFSAKTFLGKLGNDDRALVAAFAGAPGALIPTPPLTVYAPFRDRADAPSYFATLDSLASQAGGNTPLYESLDAVRRWTVGDTSLPAGLSRAVVVFTDGKDTDCAGEACVARRAQSILQAREDGVRVFTIGLSRGVDIAALGELANQTGGALLYADSAEQLLPLYGSVGQLLSLSLPTYRLRWTVRADSPDAFRPGHTLLGRVSVAIGSGTFDVPFIVGVP